MTKKFDPTKPVQTRDGRRAGIYDTSFSDCYPLAGWYEGDDGEKVLTTWAIDGRYRTSGGEHFLDLINVPEKHERWINIYTNALGNVFPGSHLYRDPENAARDGRGTAWELVATVKIEFEA